MQFLVILFIISILFFDKHYMYFIKYVFSFFSLTFSDTSFYYFYFT
uniref:Uncharacterized protein n=1 Tax=Heterorhabditis bacteriophora TaxID=37862 RepID=A0A1I7WG58_HETBA